VRRDGALLVVPTQLFGFGGAIDIARLLPRAALRASRPSPSRKRHFAAPGVSFLGQFFGHVECDRHGQSTPLQACPPFLVGLGHEAGDGARSPPFMSIRDRKLDRIQMATHVSGLSNPRLYPVCKQVDEFAAVRAIKWLVEADKC